MRRVTLEVPEPFPPQATHLRGGTRFRRPHLFRRASAGSGSSDPTGLSVAAPALIVLAALGILLGAAAEPVVAQTGSTGVIQGRVSSEARGEVMAGVQLSLVGTSRSTVTDRTGLYRFAGLEPGSYTIRATFLGLDPEEATVQVVAGATTRQNLALKNAVVELATILVETQTGTQAMALNAQRTSETIVNVVHAEQIERFPASNVPSALQRIPGISAAPRQGRGEAENVSIRGLGSSLHVVTLNGQRMAASTEDNRATDISAIPVELVSGGVDVTKAFTPDMSGEATSGAINIRTRRPDGARRIARAELGGGYSDLDGDIGYRGSATWGQQSDRLSFLVTGNVQSNPWTASQLEHQWSTVEHQGAPLDVFTRQQTRQHNIYNNRYGVSANVDYYLSDETSFFAHAMTAREAHERDRYTMSNTLGNHQFTGPGVGLASGRVDITSYLEDESVENMSFAMGGRTMLGGFEVDWSASHGRGAFNRTPGVSINYRAAGVDFGYRSLNLSSLETQVEFLNRDLTDPSHYEFRSLRVDERDGTDRTYSAALDLARAFFAGGANHRVKVGTHFSSRERESTRRRVDYGVEGGLGLDEVAHSHSYMVGKFLVPFQIERASAFRFMEENQHRLNSNLEAQEIFSNDNFSNVREQVFAGYLMNTMTRDRWMVLAGLRAEYTSMDSRAFRMNYGPDRSYAGSELVEGSSGQLELLPSLHVRFSPNAMSNIRFALTQTVGRPGFRQISPYAVENHAEQTIDRGNPDLRTTRYSNVDLMAETYFEGVGIVSAGLFYKSIEDAVSSQSTMIAGGEFDGWRETQPVNLEDASLWGFETAWQQPLSFMPGAARNLRLFANYSYTVSRANYGRDRRYPLTSTTPHVLNLALLYEDPRNTGSVSVNFNSGKFSGPDNALPAALLEQYGTFGDRFQAQRPIVEVKVGRKLGSRVSTFVEAQNVFDTFTRYDYHGLERFPYRLNYFSWWANAGIRVEL